MNMHDYSRASLLSTEWGHKKAVDYHAACTACEIWVLITTEAHRRKIIVDGGLFYDKRRNGFRERALANDVPDFGAAAR